MVICYLKNLLLPLIHHLLRLLLHLLLFREKVTSLAYARASQRLISGGSDSLIISWYMNIKRKEVSCSRWICGHKKWFPFKVASGATKSGLCLMFACWWRGRWEFYKVKLNCEFSSSSFPPVSLSFSFSLSLGFAFSSSESYVHPYLLVSMEPSIDTWMGGKWLLSTMFTTILLEFKSNVRSKNYWFEATSLQEVW